MLVADDATAGYLICLGRLQDGSCCLQMEAETRVEVAKIVEGGKKTSGKVTEDLTTAHKNILEDWYDSNLPLQEKTIDSNRLNEEEFT